MGRDGDWAIWGARSAGKEGRRGWKEGGSALVGAEFWGAIISYDYTGREVAQVESQV